MQTIPSLPSLSSRPIRFLLRASAGAHASSAAPVSEVWAALAHPARWVEFDPFMRGIEPDGQRSDPAGDAREAEGNASDALEVAVGQQLTAHLRLLRVQIPVEVEHVVNRSSLATSAQLLPGLEEDVEHLLIPQASGGTLVTARITLHGPLALPALLPRWVFRSLAVRLLARTAENGLRERLQEIPSVA
jgi:hypothetical protein